MSQAAAPGPSATLDDWLGYIEHVHGKPMELGLARMRAMTGKLGIRFSCPVFTVAGTNGKGSTSAMLESIIRHAGLRVGMHTSPHLVRFNERVLINGREAGDDEIITAFRRVEEARGGMPLTYFEFTGLAILLLFMDAGLDAVILEIGLGGRLDAMNAIDTDCGIVCAIGIDHTAWLGDTREKIGLEKACIYRRGKPAVCSDPEPPQSLVRHAEETGAPLYLPGRDFRAAETPSGFDFFMAGEGARPDLVLKGLPRPALAGAHQVRNAAGAIAALSLMRGRCRVPEKAIREGLSGLRLSGRFETVPSEETGAAPVILDVGHNPQAVSVLLDNLRTGDRAGLETWAVFGMLRDKDMEEVSRIIAPAVDRWFIAPLPGPRGASASELSGAMERAGIDMGTVTGFDSVPQALAAALGESGQRLPGTVRIAAFGSFLTVASALKSLRKAAPEDIFP